MIQTNWWGKKQIGEKVLELLTGYGENFTFTVTVTVTVSYYG